MDRERPRTAFAQLDSSHRRHEERLDGLTGAAARLAKGLGGMTDVEEILDATAFFGRQVNRHFGDEDEVVFPALAAAAPALADQLAALTAEHAPLQAGFATLGDRVRAWDERVPDGTEAASFATDADELIARYRDHATREDALFVEAGDVLAAQDAALLAALEARRGGGGGGGGRGGGGGGGQRR